jgi:hypothetical protein
MKDVIGFGVFVMLVMIFYIILTIHSVQIIDTGEEIKLVWVQECVDSDLIPYTVIKSIVLWKRKK